jgi:hypothetical protein
MKAFENLSSLRFLTRFSPISPSISGVLIGSSRTGPRVNGSPVTIGVRDGLDPLLFVFADGDEQLSDE